MKFSRSNTYASAVLICALLSPVLPAQAVVPDETTTITLDQAVHFIGTDGSDAVAPLRTIPSRPRRNGFASFREPNAGMPC